MENSKKNELYDRLLSITFEIDSQSIPDPQYINNKIGKCHALIDEVEKYSIKISKETSIIQRALNNSLASYDSKKHEMMVRDPEIKDLPNIKDREAKVNTKLKEELNEIKTYQNELSDLNNLFKAISLKLKNLNRANSDIKSQIKIMESQIRLGSSLPSESVTKNLMEELQKSTMGEDSFKEVQTKVEIEETADPSEPLDIDNLLKKENINEKLLEVSPPVGILETPSESGTENSPEPLDIDNLLKKENIEEKLLNVTSPIGTLETPPEENTKNISNDPGDTDNQETTVITDPSWGNEALSEDIVNEAKSELMVESSIDIDSIIGENLEQKGGATDKTQTEELQKGTLPESAETGSKPKKESIDIDSLLDELNK